MELFKNKVALVTGGSRGIGREIVSQLAAEGANVAFTYANSQDTAESLAKELSKDGNKVIAIKADSGDSDSIVAAVEQVHKEFGNLDILVNNAGVATMGPLPEISIAEFDRVYNINVKGVFVASQAAAAIMNDGGRIINIGSTAGERNAYPGTSVYGMTKAAVASLTRGIARDLGHRGITANTVQPGPVDTDMNPADSPYADMLRSTMALGHYGTPSDIAGLVLFLASDSGKFITGASINIDGGMQS